MDWNLFFFINCVLLGVGLAMDAFSVSIANCLANPKMSRREMTGMALSYGIFQFIMPMAGWFCVHTIVSIFEKFQPFIPWIALALLLFIGGKMLIEGIRENSRKKEENDGREAEAYEEGQETDGKYCLPGRILI